MDAATQTSNGAAKVGALEAAPRELTDRLGALEVAPAGLERNGYPPPPQFESTSSNVSAQFRISKFQSKGKRSS